MSFDPSVSARFTMVEITPDGLIVRGDIGSTTARAAPVVTIAEAEHGQAFTAFQSWIPGGSLERLTWSWVEYPGLIPTVWSGVTRTLTDAHRFILPKPAAAMSLSNICLRIEGTQTAPNGNLVSIAGGPCAPSRHGPR